MGVLDSLNYFDFKSIGASHLGESTKVQLFRFQSHYIASHPEFLNKTIFYRGGKAVQSPFG
jgi:hypothetical protein